MKTMAMRIGIIALIGVGGLVARPFLAGGAADLKIGECFDPPAVGETVDDVQHHPCTDAHGGEVFFVGDVAAADDAPYPTDIAFETQVQGLCTPAFDAYTGLDFVTDPVWTYGYLSPTAESWADGDRGIICYAARLDGATTTTSIKAAS